MFNAANQKSRKNSTVHWVKSKVINAIRFSWYCKKLECSTFLLCPRLFEKVFSMGFQSTYLVGRWQKNKVGSYSVGGRQHLQSSSRHLFPFNGCVHCFYWPWIICQYTQRTRLAATQQPFKKQLKHEKWPLLIVCMSTVTHVKNPFFSLQELRNFWQKLL